MKKSGFQLKCRKESFESIQFFSSKENLAKRNLSLSGAERRSADEKVKTFAKDVAEKTGQTDRCIRRYIQIANGLSGEIVDLLKVTTIVDCPADLEAQAAIKDVEKFNNSKDNCLIYGTDKRFRPETFP